LIRKRPNFDQEIKSVEQYKPKCKSEFFPQSLISLVEKWQSVLDRSRTQTKDHNKPF